MRFFPLVCGVIVSSIAATSARAESAPKTAPADANATYVLAMPASPERPAHRVAFSIGGSYPAAATVQAHGIFGVAPLSAARLSVSALWHYQQAEQGVRHRIQPVVLLGPTAIFDMLRYVPHVFVQGGVALLPVAPVIAFGAGMEQFFTLRTSAVATLQGVWQHRFGMRVEAQMGISFAGL